MIIGKDFDKIEFELFGLELLEPNAFIGDMLISLVAIICFFKLRKIPIKTPYFSYWRWVFLIYFISFLSGGFGHLMFNYWGVPGRILPFFAGIGISFAIEHAMISLHPKQKQWFLLSKIKAVIAVLVLLYVLMTWDLSDPSRAFIVPSMNSFIGMTLTLGVLGWKYAKTINRSFIVFPISVLILLPAAVVQAMKINIHPWFDRNDFGHLLVMVTLILYYRGIVKHQEANYSNEQSLQPDTV